MLLYQIWFVFYIVATIHKNVLVFLVGKIQLQSHKDPQNPYFTLFTLGE